MRRLKLRSSTVQRVFKTLRSSTVKLSNPPPRNSCCYTNIHIYIHYIYIVYIYIYIYIYISIPKSRCSRRGDSPQRSGAAQKSARASGPRCTAMCVCVCVCGCACVRACVRVEQRRGRHVRADRSALPGCADDTRRLHARQTRRRGRNRVGERPRERDRKKKKR
jgi:hypothetical protein